MEGSSKATDVHSNFNLQLEKEENDVCDGEASDIDDCNEEELKNIFPKSYSILAEHTVTPKDTYILHMSYKNQRICIGLSNGVSEVYNLSDKLNKICTLGEHTNCIIDVKFVTEENLLYTGSMDGTIKLWDIRTPQKSITTFSNQTSQGITKLFTSFDFSQRILCAGTELYEGDSFLLFWDIRNSKFLGGYWESHMDDITKVVFHPEDRNKLSSCSTDGLVNVYNLLETSEDDALTCSLNTESSVDQIFWYNYKGSSCIASVTHPTEIQLWNVAEGVPHCKFTREQLSKEIKRSSPEHCYVANIHSDVTRENLIVLTGSNWHNGECVRGINVINNQIYANFTLEGNRQRIQTSSYDDTNDILITGGEKGVLNVWKVEKSSYNILKSIKKNKLHSNKPY